MSEGGGASAILVHIVDDDESIRDSLTWLLASRGLAARSYASGEAFLETWSPELRGVILLDVRMGGMSGLEVLDVLVARGARQPVAMLSGHGDVPLAVSALKKGASDFMEKPFNDNQLVDRLQELLVQEGEIFLRSAGDSALAARRALLSEREREVMTLMISGKLNKQIAGELNIAIRTVEVHRARVLEKMGVRNAVELAALLSTKD
jgi:two-component system, LuxR family, response regulator DctR